MQTHYLHKQRCMFVDIKEEDVCLLPHVPLPSALYMYIKRWLRSGQVSHTIRVHLENFSGIPLKVSET